MAKDIHDQSFYKKIDQDGKEEGKKKDPIVEGCNAIVCLIAIFYGAVIVGGWILFQILKLL